MRSLRMSSLSSGTEMVRKNAACYLAGIMVIPALKHFYSTATADDLLWMLRPLAFLVELITGTHFQYDSTAGFVSIASRVVIAPACAGINFLIICFATLFFTLVSRMETATTKWVWFAVSMVAAYLVTLWANSVRIIVSIHLYGAHIYGGWITPERVHRLAGTLLYVPVLVMTYVLAERLVRHHCTSRAALPEAATPAQIIFAPLAWYIAIAIVVPLLNGSLHRYGSLYLEHALLVLAATLFILLLWCIAKSIKKNIDLSRETKENRCRLNPQLDVSPAGEEASS